jgi:hypothetical protein
MKGRDRGGKWRSQNYSPVEDVYLNPKTKEGVEVVVRSANSR